ncbi:acyltransferase [Clostridium sp. YIM B02551]|uniref:acyltransferase family protein n=1 Tax=Clostridium sp. YIM B02551 TaxID=2910679 RepID=UPI001EEB7CFC|nr:acyltransferase [Clostridium sp. YIM B02551]
METNNKSYYGMIDVLRLLFAVAVVSIHTMAFHSINENLWIATSMGISRLAVPFFFMVSGYFLFDRIQLKKEPKATLKRLLILYLSWVTIEIIALFPIVLSSLGAPPIMLIERLLLVGITGSLWYISSLIITIFIISPLLKKDKIFILLLIGFVLYLFGTTGDTYYGLFQATLINPLIKGYTSIFMMPQIGVTESILFVSLGAFINKYKLNKKIKKAGLLSIISIILLLVEAFILNKTGVSKDANMYLSAIIAAPLILIWAINYSKNISTKISKACREYSIGIYCSHQIIMIWLSVLAPILFANTMIRFICSLLISAALITVLRKTRVKKILLK